MGYRGRDCFTHLMVAASICAGAARGDAQQQKPPKWELYGGYSAINTGEPVFGLLPGGITPVSGCLCWNPRGAGATLTYDIRPWIGVTADFSGHWGNHPATLADQLTHADFYNVSAGPKFTYTSHHVAPFAEFLAGGHRLAPELFQYDDRFGIMAGGGIDLEAGRHFSVRLVRADYVYSNHHFGPEATVPTTEVRGVRLQTGVVYRFGGSPAVLPPPPLPASPPPPPPPAIPVFEPPSVTCTANPTVVNAGDPSTITANAVSPQGRPLVYSYQATAGSILGSASTTTLATAGAPAGPITVTCQVADDKGHTASASTSVTVVVPVGPVKPPTSKLCSITFERDLRRPDRVDNEAKACLDEIALSLQRNPDTKLAVIGNAEPGKGSKTLAAKRAVNTKAYLVEDKGVDPSRIGAYVGASETKSVDNVLVPPGASLDVPETSPVDEGTIKPVKRSTGRHSR